MPQPSEPVVLVELDRGAGFSTRVELRPDGKEDVVQLHGSRELERYTREARFGR